MIKSEYVANRLLAQSTKELTKEHSLLNLKQPMKVDSHKVWVYNPYTGKWNLV